MDENSKKPLRFGRHLVGIELIKVLFTWQVKQKFSWLHRPICGVMSGSETLVSENMRNIMAECIELQQIYFKKIEYSLRFIERCVE